MNIVSTGQLKAQSISIQVSDRTRCNGSCKCCISRTTPNTTGIHTKAIQVCKLGDVEKGLGFAKNIGATHAIITGKAEPTQEKAEYIYSLIGAARSKDLLVDMHTNGFLLQDSINNEHNLESLVYSGLTMITFSVFHYDPLKHREITGLKVDFPNLIRKANRLGLLVRCSLVLSKETIGTPDEVIKYIAAMGDYGAHMVVVREIWLPRLKAGVHINEEVYNWNIANVVKLYEVSNEFSDIAKTKHISAAHYKAPIYELAPLPWGAKVFAMEGCFQDPEHGVNVTFALCEENDKGPVMKSIVHKPNGHGYCNWDFNSSILY